MELIAMIKLTAEHLCLCFDMIETTAKIVFVHHIFMVCVTCLSRNCLIKVAFLSRKGAKELCQDNTMKI